WEASTGRPIGHPLTGHTGFVYGVAFSPVAKTIASAGDDGTVRLWEASTGKPIGHPLTGHTGPVFGMALSTAAGRSSAPAWTGRCGCGKPPPASRSAGP